MNTNKLLLAAGFALASMPALAQKVMDSGNVLAAPKPAMLPLSSPPAPAPVPAPVVSKVAPTMAPTIVKIAPVATTDPLPPKPGVPGASIAPMAKTLGDAKNLNTASISAKDLKQNIDLKGLSDQNPNGGITGVKDRMMRLGGEGKGSLSKNVFGEGKEIGRGGGLDEMVNEAPIKGAKYGDTFGGGRINSKKQGDARNFAGNGKGRVSDLEGEAAVQGGGDAATIGGMLKTEGGTPTGDVKKDMAELAYAQSVGTDGYAATKNMTQEQRQQYWTDQQNKQLVGGRPKEDDLGSGAAVPMGRQDIVNTGRSIAGKTGAAGGGGDGRTDQQETGGGSSGGMVVLNKAGGAEREIGTGTLNLNAVLKINQTADPVPASATR